MGRTISFREACVAQPTLIDVALAGAEMLFPDDPTARGECFDSAIATGLSNGDFVPGANSPPNLPFQVALNAWEPRRRDAMVELPMVHGAIAGGILADVVGAAQTGEPISMGTAISRAARAFCYKRPKWKVTPKTINNSIWPRFRPVAHFWAAYIDKRPADSFPCSPWNLHEFLSTAEAYRLLGESSSTFKAKSTILRRDEMTRLPDAILAQLEVRTLQFSRKEALH